MYQPPKSGDWFPMGSRSHSREFHNTRRDIGSGGRRRQSFPQWCRQCRFCIFHNADVVGFAVLRTGCAVWVVPVEENDHAGSGLNRIIRPLLAAAESIIKQIHTLVLMDRPEDRGVYRRIPVKIMAHIIRRRSRLLFRNRWKSS